MLSRVAFGCILLPIVYLIGFMQRENAENVYKSLGLILYIVGHLLNMIILSVVGFLTNDGKLCDINQTAIIIVGMINPFTYNFFNPVLDHFICERLSPEAHTIQWIYSIAQMLLGTGIYFLVVHLEEKSFRRNFVSESLIKKSHF